MEETTGIFLGATVALVAYAVFALAFARVLHTRDPGRGRLDRWRAQVPDGDLRARRLEVLWWYGAVPGAVCVLAAVLAVLAVGITEGREVEDVYAIAAALVAAVRILAYLWVAPADELAKMVPIALLTVALFQATDLDLTTWQDGVVEAGTEHALAYAIGLVLLEWGLRAASGVAGRRGWDLPRS